MNALIFSKLVFALAIFTLTLATGLAYLKIDHRNSLFTELADAFASGIFLGVALLHLLPDAVEKFTEIVHIEYPIIYLVAIFTWLLLLFVDTNLTNYAQKHTAHRHCILPAMLISLLTIHSLIEGAAVGINSSFLETLTIFIAIFAHKGSESFALSANLAQRFSFTAKQIKHTCWIFSLMTPIGIITATSVAHLLNNEYGAVILSLFNALAAGTFLYLGTEHLLDTDHTHHFGNSCAVISGVGIMAIVALVV